MFNSKLKTRVAALERATYTQPSHGGNERVYFIVGIIVGMYLGVVLMSMRQAA